MHGWTPEQQREKWQQKLKASGRELLQCPECGKYFIRLGGHVIQVHGYATAREFYDEHGMAYKEGSTAEYKQIMRDKTNANGTAKYLATGAKTRFVKNGNHGKRVSEYWRRRNANTHPSP